MKTKQRSTHHIRRFWTIKKYTISSLLITKSSWNSQSQAGSSDGKIKSLNYPTKCRKPSSLTPTERNWLHSELSIKSEKPFWCSCISGLILGCNPWLLDADWVKSTFLTKNTKCVPWPPWNWATSTEILLVVSGTASSISWISIPFSTTSSNGSMTPTAASEK